MKVDKIVGKGAPTEFIEQLEDMVNTHHERVEVDVIRAYHFGARFIVEVCAPCPPCARRLPLLQTVHASIGLSSHS